MGMAALRGIESLKKKKKVVKQIPAAPVAAVIEVEEQPQPKIVRVPRTTPGPIQKRVDKLSAGEAISDDGNLGKSIATQARRQDVLAWMLNGHTHEGQLCDIHMLADKLDVPVKTVNVDIKAIKDRMAKFYTEDDDTRDIAALAHMLLEMKFRDRGNALLLYNLVLEDIRKADAAANQAKMAGKPGKFGYGELTGRDRAAMYSTALAAIDLANRTTNGMESLLKLTGGAAKLQLIIKAKNLQLNKGNGVQMDSASIQQIIAGFMGGVLPSNRGNLAIPPALQLDDDDERILAISTDAKSKKVIDAQPK